MQRILTYVFEENDGPGGVSKVRLTVGTVKLFDMGRHALFADECRKLIVSVTPVKDDKQGEPEPQEPRDLALVRVWRRWPHLVVSLRKIELGRTDEPDEWKDALLQDLGWTLPDGILDIPSDLFYAWEEQALLCNDGMFAPRMSAEGLEKKTGLVSVS